ncbi:tetratricopeptide repeat protein (plasmid) [Pseudanabaena biceps]|nr:tetratricopeptide repeat protein [Pseudanabaena biceps]
MRVLIPVLALGLVAAPANAAGGGGMSSVPSASAPQYDAATEYRKGVVALQAKDFKAAKTAFDHALSVAPRDANSQYMAGVARTGLGDLKGARKFYAKAAKTDANMIAAWRDLGVTDGQLGDKEKARETLDVIQSRRSTCTETCPQAAALKEADEAVTVALNGVPTASAVPASGAEAGALLFASSGFGDSEYLAAVALINDRNYEQAIAALQSAQRAFGAHPDILTYLGFANRKLGRFDIAESYYRAALAVAPGHRGATEYFGELMVERRDMASARRMLARLDAQCRFGCTEAEELRAWISVGHSPHSS